VKKPLLHGFMLAVGLLASMAAWADATVVNIYNFTRFAAEPMDEQGIREFIPPKSCMQVGITRFPVKVGFRRTPESNPHDVDFEVSDPHLVCGKEGRLYSVKGHQFCIDKQTFAGVYLLDLVIIGHDSAYLRNSLGDCPAHPVPWYIGV